ncbi:MAG: NrtA/SsuA/CpmA family ABC transporter substrate-binding protein, partial [Gallionella sp.]
MRITLLLSLLVIALCGCQKNSADGALQTSKGIPKKITVTYTYQPQSTLVHVAMAKGYFKDEGLEVEPIMRTFGRASLQTVLDGESNFATVAETPVMFSVLNGEKIYVIANIEASNLNNAIVARKSAGISVPADLKGKRIGYTPGTTSDFFLDSLLTVYGMKRNDVRPVELKPEEMFAAIESRQVDAVSTWNYPLTLIKQN